MLIGIICKALRFIQNLFLKVFSSLEILISAVLGILGAIIDIANIYNDMENHGQLPASKVLFKSVFNGVIMTGSTAVGAVKLN